MKEKEKKQIYFGSKYDFDDQEVSIVKYWGRCKQSIRWDDVVNVSTFQRQNMEFLRISTMDKKFDIGSALGDFAGLKTCAEQALARNCEKLKKQPAVKFIYPDYIISNNRKYCFFNILGIVTILILLFSRFSAKNLNDFISLLVFWNSPSMTEAHYKLIGLMIGIVLLVFPFTLGWMFIGATKNIVCVLTDTTITIEHNERKDIHELADIVGIMEGMNFLKIRFRDGSKLKVYDNLTFLKLFREKLEAGSKTKIAKEKSFRLNFS